MIDNEEPCLRFLLSSGLSMLYNLLKTQYSASNTEPSRLWVIFSFLLRFSCNMQASWKEANKKQQEKLLELIRRLAEDDKEGVIAHKVCCRIFPKRLCECTVNNRGICTRLISFSSAPKPQ